MLQDDELPVDDAPADDDDGADAPRRSYNFAPGYHGLVYRADVPDWGAGPRREHGGGKAPSSTASKTKREEPDPADAERDVRDARDAPAADSNTTAYKLQSMKWGLIPSWTKRSPDYGTMLKTINCRDDSLSSPGGMWSSMKARKRCVVVAQGFYEWLKPARIPHFVRRRDGRLMLLAGLWDCVRYGGDGGGDDEAKKKHYTYTVITTSSNAQLRFLHDRMPVVLDPGSAALRTWLDPARSEWHGDLESVLKPYEGELDVYAVSKEVGKVGNESPNFMVPVASRENKNNIANFFAKARDSSGGEKVEKRPEEKLGDRAEKLGEALDANHDVVRVEEAEVDDTATAKAAKRTTPPSPDHGAEPGPAKKVKTEPPPEDTKTKSPSPKKTPGRQKISATSNQARTPVKAKPGKAEGCQKITKFFGNSA